MDYLLAADLGSSSCKTIVMDSEGRTLGSAQMEYPTLYPRPGWAEQNPEDWYRAFAATSRAAISESGINPGRLAGVGIIGVTHNAALLDRAGLPLRPSILLFDNRSAAEAVEINDRWGGRIEKRTLNRTSPMWTWPQLAWLRRHEPEILLATRRLLFQKDYVRHRLAPSQVTDFIDAHGSSLFDPMEGVWIPEFLTELRLDPSVMPTVVDPTAIVGRVGRQGAVDSGIPEGVPVIAGTTDTAAELVGSGAVMVGTGIVKLASVGRIAIVSEKPHSHPTVINYRHVLPGLWYPGTACKHAASAYRWLRDLLWTEEGRSDPGVFEKMNMDAGHVQPGCDGLLFHPHLTGEWAPHFNDSVRGSFTGISMAHGRAHITRAVLEGVAFALRDALEHIEAQGLKSQEFSLIGQGARGKLWRRIIASTLNRPLVLPTNRDAVYGAALVTAMGLGFLSQTPGAVRSKLIIEEVIEPEPELAETYDSLFKRYRTIDSALIPHFGGDT